MKIKEALRLSDATMQALVLSPYFIVVIDETKASGVNIITISYVGVLSEKPPIIGLSIRPQRYSHKLIREHGELTLNLPLPSMLKDLDYCGSVSGRKYDKASERKIELEKSEAIKTPRIKMSPLSLECKLRDVLFLSKDGASHDFFMADVVAFQRNKGFLLEESEVIATTNYDYRQVGIKIGKAFRTWRKKKEV